MKLSKLFSDGMMLQRGQNTTLWGQTKPDQSVIVQFIGITYETKANEEGKFTIVFDKLEAGGPYMMELNDGESITIRDILIGDIWLLNGQSNMELPVRRTLDLYEEEVKHVYENRIRMFAVPMQYKFNGQVEEITQGIWKCVTPDQVLDFSAAGYFFSKELFETYGVPIGLVQTAVGGTPIEAWLSEECIESVGGYEEELFDCKNEVRIKEIQGFESNKMEQWYSSLNDNDPGIKESWYMPWTDSTTWKFMGLPGMFDRDEFTQYYGSIWFQKEIEISKQQLNNEAKLILGTIVDADETYVNGEFVGATGYLYPPRRYKLPVGILKEGRNTITIRLVCTRNKGGFIPDMPYKLTIGKDSIDLMGEWKYRMGFKTISLPDTTFFQYKPSGVYNGMLYPIRNFTFKGLAFYQGESNTGKPLGYEKLFCIYIDNIRTLFKNLELPIIYVQLANFIDGEKSEVSDYWAKLREEQRRALKVHNTAMVVTIDIGEANDLHPQNKKELGRRLALAARRIAYGEEIVYSGPMLERAELNDNNIYLHFSYSENGFIIPDSGIKGFEISEDEEIFFPAEVTIENKYLVVSCKGLTCPKRVRYAWADNPENPNLYNIEGLPASPFTTTIYSGEVK